MRLDKHCSFKGDLRSPSAYCQTASTFTTHVAFRLIEFVDQSRPQRFPKRPSTSRHDKHGSLSHWTLKDLQSYNIHFHEQNALTFFDIQELPEPAIELEALDAALVSLFQSVMSSNLAVVDFTIKLFYKIGYGRDGRLASTQVPLPFRICSKHRYAQPDLCVVDENDRIYLVVREDKGHQDPVVAQAQLVAAAVAAFTENNKNRVASGLDSLSETVSRLVMISHISQFILVGHARNSYGGHITDLLQDSRQ